jgi:addiction module HigA family antidote
MLWSNPAEMPKLSIPTHKRPPTPGDMLLEEFLKPLGISQSAFAQQIGVSYPRLNEIIHGKRSVTPDTAMRFEQALGMDAQSWLNLQTIVDLYDAQHSPTAKEIRKIKRVKELGCSRECACKAPSHPCVWKEITSDGLWRAERRCDCQPQTRNPRSLTARGFSRLYSPRSSGFQDRRIQTALPSLREETTLVYTRLPLCPLRQKLTLRS